MSSALPTRRITRTTRTTALKDTENANARPSRISTRAKPLTSANHPTATKDIHSSNIVSSHSSALTGAAGRLTAATAASKAKSVAATSDLKSENTAVKRKREALGEIAGPVTNHKSTKPVSTAAGAGKGKEKDSSKEKFDGVVIKSKTTATTTTAATRLPLRTVAGGTSVAPTTRSTSTSTEVHRTTRSHTHATAAAGLAAASRHPPAKPEPSEEREPIKLKSDNAMAIDVPVAAPAPAPPPPAPGVGPAPVLPSIAVRRSNHSLRETRETRERSSHAVTHRERLANGHSRTSSRVVVQPQRKVEEEEDFRVFKKPRTSSDAPEDEDPEAARLAAEERRHQERIAAMIEAYANEPEHDPETSAWDDLDAEDSEDPLMVSEYVVDIFNYMKELELTTMPNPNYMESQKELAWKMRGILTDWLIQVHVRFRLLPETLFLCVNIIDRFLSARVVSLAKLQLVGITCMFIAAKFEEIVAPSVTHFLTCADSSYTEAEILQAERYVLKTLDWNLSYPNPVHYLRRVSKADEYNVRVRTLGKYLLEIGCLEWRLIAAPPSLIAAAAIWFARLALGLENWTPNLAHYSSYPESALIPTANLMLNYILKPIQHESFHKKYAGKRYFKSSMYMREWALSRWPEGTRVHLADELPRIKAEIRIEREDEEKRVALETQQRLLDEDAEEVY
ncbi:hypothetical protein AX16_004704 [Volvariella volvacea WC 439]|nr:hypothetical protein AX16_004704 [Volvariella volvacea WC 439]